MPLVFQGARGDAGVSHGLVSMALPLAVGQPKYKGRRELSEAAFLRPQGVDCGAFSHACCG